MIVRNALGELADARSHLVERRIFDGQGGITLPRLWSWGDSYIVPRVIFLWDFLASWLSVPVSRITMSIYSSYLDSEWLRTWLNVYRFILNGDVWGGTRGSSCAFTYYFKDKYLKIKIDNLLKISTGITVKIFNWDRKNKTGSISS